MNPDDDGDTGSKTQKRALILLIAAVICWIVGTLVFVAGLIIPFIGLLFWPLALATAILLIITFILHFKNQSEKTQKIGKVAGVGCLVHSGLIGVYCGCLCICLLACLCCALLICIGVIAAISLCVFSSISFIVLVIIVAVIVAVIVLFTVVLKK